MPSKPGCSVTNGAVDQARIRDHGVPDHCEALPPDLGPEPTEAGEARLRAKRCGDRVLAEARIPGDRPPRQAGTRHDLLGHEMGLLRKLTLRGERQVGWLFTFAAAVYKLVWTSNFVEVAA